MTGLIRGSHDGSKMIKSRIKKIRKPKVTSRFSKCLIFLIGQRDIVGLDEYKNRLLFLDAEDDLDESLIVHKSLLKRYLYRVYTIN